MYELIGVLNSDEYNDDIVFSVLDGHKVVLIDKESNEIITCFELKEIQTVIKLLQQAENKIING